MTHPPAEAPGVDVVEAEGTEGEAPPAEAAAVGVAVGVVGFGGGRCGYTYMYIMWM